MGKFKSWLLQKTHRLLGTAQLHEQARRTNDLLRDLSVTLSAQAGHDAVRGQIQAPQADRLESLSHDGLFVVGCARSGTTILTRCLNRAPEIMLLEEPYFFLAQDVADFAGYFNDRQAAMGNRSFKGTYVPPPIVPELGPIGLLCRLRRGFRFVGEKVSFGPQDFPPDWCRAYLDFQSKYFLHSRYVFILRRPVEVLWSMHKMFPDSPVPRLFETWLRSVAVSLDAYQFFAQSRLVFFEDLGPPMIERLADWLRLPIPQPPGTLDRMQIHSKLRPGEIPAALLAFEELCARCTDIYRELRANVSSDQFRYSGSVSQWSFFYSLHRRIDEMLDQLQPPPRSNEAVIKQFVLRIPRPGRIRPEPLATPLGTADSITSHERLDLPGGLRLPLAAAGERQA